MSSVPVSPRRVFGVELSGACDAGRHTWICRAHPGTNGIRVESIDPLRELPGGVIEREAALQALVQKVTESSRSAWGFNFPFGLPKAILDVLAPGVSGHADQLRVMVSLGKAGKLLEQCTGISPSAELRRRTDDEASTPFSPYNQRAYKKTFHGLTEVLGPLRSRPEVAVLPFDALPLTERQNGDRLPFNRVASADMPHIYVMEVCPASVLAKLGYPTHGYRGGSESEAEARREMLRRLINDGLMRPMTRAQKGRVMENEQGAALDSIFAAVGAWRGTRDYDHAALRADPMYGLEGFVYT